MSVLEETTHDSLLPFPERGGYALDSNETFYEALPDLNAREASQLYWHTQTLDITCNITITNDFQEPEDDLYQRTFSFADTCRVNGTTRVSDGVLLSEPPLASSPAELAAPSFEYLDPGHNYTQYRRWDQDTTAGAGALDEFRFGMNFFSAASPDAQFGGGPENPNWYRCAVEDSLGTWDQIFRPAFVVSLITPMPTITNYVSSAQWSPGLGSWSPSAVNITFDGIVINSFNWIQNPDEVSVSGSISVTPNSFV
ncbi:MAG: hypothetical protein AAGD22_09360 [Verrucomicrobiota bacterium]